MLVMANKESEHGCFRGTDIAHSPLYCPTIEKIHHSSRNGEFQVGWRYSYFAAYFRKSWFGEVSHRLEFLDPYIRNPRCTVKHRRRPGHHHDNDNDHEPYLDSGADVKHPGDWSTILVTIMSHASTELSNIGVGHQPVEPRSL